MSLPPDLKLLTAGDFEPFIGQTFRVEASPEALEIQLDAVERRPRLTWMLREPFTLLFSTPSSVLLEEGSYRMQPEGGEPLDIYVIPIQELSSDRRAYQAVFN